MQGWSTLREVEKVKPTTAGRRLALRDEALKLCDRFSDRARALTLVHGSGHEPQVYNDLLNAIDLIHRIAQELRPRVEPTL